MWMIPSQDVRELEEAENQVLEKLASFGFYWKASPVEIEDEIVVFHQKWDILKDQVTPGLNFNIHTKKRGVAKGCELTSMTNDEIDKVKVTKTLLARLLGQIYDLSGILAPIRAALFSLFSKACALLKN